ncbi:MAG: zinc ABC transporter substrate-binding protein [Acidimicrobiia bacterium]|nr:zinc ABC transporter substrate-binding protein [Acidimicrobiia bacterium]
MHPTTRSAHPRRALLAAVLAVVLLAAACGSDSTADSSGDAGAGDSGSTGETAIKVATSIPPLQDLVARVAGDRAEVFSIVPAGVDGHTYEPTPGDVRSLSEVSLLFVPDVNLNARVTELAGENLPDGATMVDLNARVVPGEEIIHADSHSHGDGPAHGHEPNVHTWTNILFTLPMLDEIADELIAVDPEGEATYLANRDALAAEIVELEAAARAALETIPTENRTLVVYHDSWSYFGREYGFDVVGALQAVDFAEPSASEMRGMVAEVQAAGVPAFFGSEVFPTSVLEQVAAESGVDYVGNLSDDKLPGAPGDPEYSYVGMMAANVRSIVEGLGGDASGLDDVDPARG